jgi:hypothetical protein
VNKEQAARQIAAHERAAASATDPAKRFQHEEAIRHYRAKYDIPAPNWHPPAAEIFAELERIGMADQLQDFWRFHQGQTDGPLGEHNYQLAFLRLRKVAAVAAATYGKPVWIPSPVGFNQRMQFFRVPVGVPKGTRQFVPTIEVLT